MKYFIFKVKNRVLELFEKLIYKISPTLSEKYLNHKFKFIPDDLCCCGDIIGHGGSICHHGGCRSSKEYNITMSIESYKKNK